MKIGPDGAKSMGMNFRVPMEVFNTVISIEALAPFSTRRWSHETFTAYSARMWLWILDNRETLGLVLTSLIRDGFLPKELQSDLKKTLIPLSEIIELKKMETPIPATIRTPTKQKSEGNIYDLMR